MYNKNYAWTPQWDINLYFLFSRKNMIQLLWKSQICELVSTLLNHGILLPKRQISPGLEILNC